MQQFADAQRATGKTISFVPTMGYLHKGHLALVKRAAAVADCVVVSIFVNPTQFAPDEDLDRYPHDLARDYSLLKDQGYCEVVFVPQADEIYSPLAATSINVGGVTQGLCGAFRPHHFRGVATVVAKLFNLVKPHSAVFGSKDYQQAVVIRTMVRDLNFDIKIIVVPIVRERDGLAMSSRNRFLTSDDRERSLILSYSLNKAQELLKAGSIKSVAALHTYITKIIDTQSIVLEYLEIVDTQTLKAVKKLKGTILIALAATVGTTRLIDNIVVRIPQK